MSSASKSHDMKKKSCGAATPQDKCTTNSQCTCSVPTPESYLAALAEAIGVLNSTTGEPS